MYYVSLNINLKEIIAATLSQSEGLVVRVWGTEIRGYIPIESMIGLAECPEAILIHMIASFRTYTPVLCSESELSSMNKRSMAAEFG
jgi:hypothetical protein